MNNRGFTIPEAILGTMIMVISLFGLLRAYSFSTGYVERIGLKRQALCYVQQEYEKVRNYSDNGEVDLTPMAINEKEISFINNFNKSKRETSGFLSTIIEDLVDEDGFTYQGVTISLHYSFENVSDTIMLPARFYRDK